MHKKDIVAGLVSRYLDVADHGSREALGAASMPRASAGFGEPPRGSYTFKPYDQPEVMTAEQAGAFLQIAPEVVIDLADAGTLPGRKLAGAWRFARTALIGWLSTSPRESR